MVLSDKSIDYIRDFQERTDAQKRQAWLFLVDHNYTRLFGRHLKIDFEHNKLEALLGAIFDEGLSHLDAAVALAARAQIRELR